MDVDLKVSYEELDVQGTDDFSHEKSPHFLQYLRQRVNYFS